MLELVDTGSVGSFGNGAGSGEDAVDALHAGQALWNAVSGFCEVLYRIDDAVKDNHVEDEGGRVDETVVRKDEGAAEHQHHANEHGAKELAHWVGEGLTSIHPGCLAAHCSGDVSETLAHLLLGSEGLHYAQAAEGLFHLAHGVAPEALDLGGALFEVTPDNAHQPGHQRCEGQNEER